MAVQAIKKLEPIGKYFVGQSDIVLFDKPTDLATAKLSTLEGAVSLGNIHLDSTDFTGEEASIEGLKNEQGDTYYSITTKGDFGFSFFIPSTSEAVMEKLLGVETISDTFAETTPWDTGSTVYGFDGSNFLDAPIALINDTKDMTLVIPNAKLTVSLGIVDKVQGLNVSVMAQDIDTATLKTLMRVHGKAKYGV